MGDDIGLWKILVKDYMYKRNMHLPLFGQNN